MHKSPEGPTREGTEKEHHVVLMGTDSELGRTGLSSSSSASQLTVSDTVLNLSVSQFPLCKMKTTTCSYATEPHISVCRRRSLHAVWHSRPARPALTPTNQQHRGAGWGHRILRYCPLGPRFLKRSRNTFENEFNRNLYILKKDLVLVVENFRYLKYLHIRNPTERTRKMRYSIQIQNF